jgi:hypothetical protein
MQAKILTLSLLSFFLVGCNNLAPIQETVREKTVGFRVTAPETVTEEGILPSVEYTVPVEPNQEGIAIPPKEIPKGATVEPIKVLVRESMVNPAWKEAMETARAVNSIANPTPTAPLVGLAISALGYLLGGIAAFRNRQARQAVEQFKGALVTVVRAVETFNSADLKRTIARKAQLEGTQTIIHQIVKQET